MSGFAWNAIRYNVAMAEQPQKWSRGEIWAAVGAIATVLCLLAAILVIPEFRRAVGLDRAASSSPEAMEPQAKFKPEVAKPVVPDKIPVASIPTVPAKLVAKVAAKPEGRTTQRQSAPPIDQTSVSSNTQTAQAPTYEQKCETSACAQGPGSQATYNQYGPAKLTMTQDQQAAITKAMLPYAGLEFTIERHDATKDSSEYGDKLRDALKAAGMFCTRDSTGNRIQPGGIPAGVSVTIGRGNLDKLIALAKALRISGAIAGKVSYVTDSRRQDAFDILVAPNH